MAYIQRYSGLSPAPGARLLRQAARSSSAARRPVVPSYFRGTARLLNWKMPLTHMTVSLFERAGGRARLPGPPGAVSTRRPRSDAAPFQRSPKRGRWRCGERADLSAVPSACRSSTGGALPQERASELCRGETGWLDRL
ncbi:hypothetical protein AAFF_G00157970 [Aldrovandia affinis]|uniref:Uncharacterized protein n=1 Tax=Aldrovandia affinis TaxID=143900 RepID=A0AAD7RN17_9TELE|nr:hypothetical protein AAFF_G00157970 [Aldrovandia affinis]